MSKQKVTVNVAGKPYTLVSSDPPEYVRRIAAYVDRKLSETAATTNLPSGQAAVLTCFNLAEEVMKAQDENTLLRRQMEEQMLALKEAQKKEPAEAKKETQA